jgi:hypothetical protein
MARQTGCVDQSALDRLDDMRAALEQHRREGLMPKNLQLIRQVLTQGVWSEVVSLPKALMRQARLAKDHAPIKAAVMAQLAVAIAIETFAPIRLRNLISIELGKNLIKPGGLNTPYWLVFPNYDVKNRVDLNCKFDEPLTDLIAEYVDEYRPTLYVARILAGCFRAKTVSPRTDSYSVSRSQSVFRKPSACELRSISFDTLRRRFISSTTREIMRRSGDCWDTAALRQRSNSIAVLRPSRLPSSSESSFASESNSTMSPMRELILNDHIEHQVATPPNAL